MKLQNKHSSYWLNSEVYSDCSQALKLSIIQKTIRNFVNIITKGKQIDCIFCETTSNTKNSNNKNTKNGVSCETTIIISADLENIDLTVGIALHEATHIVHSDFNYRSHLPIQIIQYILKLNIDQKVIFESLFHTLVNYIEDKRIDYLTTINSPGYIGYYHIVYDEFFNSDEITEQLLDNETKTETCKNYIFRIINMTNPDADENALIGLKQIYNTVDLDNIGRLTTMQDAVLVAWDVFNIMLQHCDVFKYDQFEESKTITLIKDQQKAIDHKYTKKKITASTKQEIDKINDANIQVKTSTFDTKSIKTYVFDDLNYNYIKKSNSQSSNYKKAVADGLLLSAKLKNKLQVRNTVKETIFSKKLSGRIDKHQLYSTEFNDRIFYTKKVEIKSDSYIHFSIDASGSMQSYWDKVIIILVSLIKSLSFFPNIHIVVSFRTTFVQNGKNCPVVYLVYDSFRSNFELFLLFLKVFSPSGLTPDGLCFSAISKQIENQSNGKQAYFINISDGLPVYYDNDTDTKYEGQLAFDHTRMEINKFKKMNINVLSYYVGFEMTNHKIDQIFKQIYGVSCSEFIYNLNNPNKIINSVNTLFC